MLNLWKKAEDTYHIPRAFVNTHKNDQFLVELETRVVILHNLLEGRGIYIYLYLSCSLVR